MKARTEKAYPYILGLIAGVLMGVACCKTVNWLCFPLGDEILSSSISLAAIFAGFLATAKSMIISVQTPVMQRIRHSRFYTLLIRYLAEAIWVALIFCAFCLAGFFVSSRGHPVFAGIWAALAVASLVSWHRVTQAFLELMKPEEQSHGTNE